MIAQKASVTLHDYSIPLETSFMYATHETEEELRTSVDFALPKISDTYETRFEKRAASAQAIGSQVPSCLSLFRVQRDRCMQLLFLTSPKLRARSHTACVNASTRIGSSYVNLWFCASTLAWSTSVRASAIRPLIAAPIWLSTSMILRYRKEQRHAWGSVGQGFVKIVQRKFNPRTVWHNI